jgi:hypothetical protein
MAVSQVGACTRFVCIMTPDWLTSVQARVSRPAADPLPTARTRAGAPRLASLRIPAPVCTRHGAALACTLHGEASGGERRRGALSFAPPRRIRHCGCSNPKRRRGVARSSGTYLPTASHAPAHRSDDVTCAEQPAPTHAYAPQQALHATGGLRAARRRQRALVDYRMARGRAIGSPIGWRLQMGARCGGVGPLGGGSGESAIRYYAATAAALQHSGAPLL